MDQTLEHHGRILPRQSGRLPQHSSCSLETSCSCRFPCLLLFSTKNSTFCLCLLLLTTTALSSTSCISNSSKEIQMKDDVLKRWCVKSIIQYDTNIKDSTHLLNIGTPHLGLVYTEFFRWFIKWFISIGSGNSTLIWIIWFFLMNDIINFTVLFFQQSCRLFIQCCWFVE